MALSPSLVEGISNFFRARCSRARIESNAYHVLIHDSGLDAKQVWELLDHPEIDNIFSNVDMTILFYEDNVFEIVERGVSGTRYLCKDIAKIYIDASPKVGRLVNYRHSLLSTLSPYPMLPRELWGIVSDYVAIPAHHYTGLVRGNDLYIPSAQISARFFSDSSSPQLERCHGKMQLVRNSVRYILPDRNAYGRYFISYTVPDTISPEQCDQVKDYLSLKEEEDRISQEKDKLRVSLREWLE